VTVRIGTQADLPMLYTMYAETSVRDGFVIRDEVIIKPFGKRLCNRLSERGTFNCGSQW